jgi:hypothetical protein
VAVPAALVRDDRDSLVIRPPASSTPRWPRHRRLPRRGRRHGRDARRQAVEAQPDTVRARRLACPSRSPPSMGASYAFTRVFAAPWARGIMGSPRPGPSDRPGRAAFPVRRFRLDAKHRILRCPAARSSDCMGRRTATASSTTAPASRTAIHTGCARSAPARPCGAGPSCRARITRPCRARRQHARWGPREWALHRGHRGRVEGVHGEAKTWHGRARAVRRGVADMQAQASLAAAINLSPLVLAALIETWPPSPAALARPSTL